MNPVGLLCPMAGVLGTRNTARLGHSVRRTTKIERDSCKEKHRWMLVLTEVEWVIVGRGRTKVVLLWA